MVSNELWWYVARSSGLVAWAAALGSVLCGLALSTKALGPRPRRPWLLDLHRFLAGLAVGFVSLHVVALVADNYISFGWTEVLVPFASSYRPTAVAWGVVAFWLLALVEVTSLVRNRLPRRVWFRIHLASYVVAVASTLHGLQAGTDSGNPVFTWVSLLWLGGTGFFLIYRVLTPVEPGGNGSTRVRARPAVYAAQAQDQGLQPPLL